MGATNSTPRTVEFVNRNGGVEISENALMRLQEAKRIVEREAKVAQTKATKTTPEATTTAKVMAATTAMPVAATTTMPVAATTTMPVAPTTTMPVQATTTKPGVTTTTTMQGSPPTPIGASATTTTKPPPPEPVAMPTLTLAAPVPPTPVQHGNKFPPQQQGYNNQKQPKPQPQKQLQKAYPISPRFSAKSAEIEETQYKNTIEKVEALLGKPVYWAQDYGKELQLLQGQVKRCYQENPNQPLRCAAMSKEYQDFVFSKQYSTIVNLRKKSPKADIQQDGK